MVLKYPVYLASNRYDNRISLSSVFSPLMRYFSSFSFASVNLYIFCQSCSIFFCERSSRFCSIRWYSSLREQTSSWCQCGSREWLPCQELLSKLNSNDLTVCLSSAAANLLKYQQLSSLWLSSYLSSGVGPKANLPAPTGSELTSLSRYQADLIISESWSLSDVLVLGFSSILVLFSTLLSTSCCLFL